MELTQLYYFLEVAHCEHFRKAAQNLHITQPTLSQSIARLEDELGCTLFDRIGRNIYLNDFGREFERYVQPAITLLDDGRRSVHDLQLGNRGNIWLGISVPEMISVFLKPYLRDHPDIHIHQYHGTASQLKEMLENREIDFAILIVPLETVDISWEPVSTEELGVLVSEQHHLAGQDSVTLEELRNEQFLVNNANQDIRDSFMACFVKAGFEPNICFEGEQTDLIGELVEQNRGITVCSAIRYQYHRARGNDKGNKYIRIDGPAHIVRTTGFSKLRNRPMSPAAAAFYEYLKFSLKNGPERE